MTLVLDIKSLHSVLYSEFLVATGLLQWWIQRKLSSKISSVHCTNHSFQFFSLISSRHTIIMYIIYHLFQSQFKSQDLTCHLRCSHRETTRNHTIAIKTFTSIHHKRILRTGTSASASTSQISSYPNPNTLPLEWTCRQPPKQSSRPQTSLRSDFRSATHELGQLLHWTRGKHRF